MKKVEFYQELRKATKYKVRVTDKTTNEIYKIKAEKYIIKSFKNHSDQEEALVEINKNTTEPYKFELTEKVLGKYLEVKESYSRL